MVNELVTNACKHAFTGRKQGSLSITAQISEPGFIALTVSDNGIGRPKDINLETTDPLGMDIIHSLVQQLRGEVQVVRDKGTEFRFKITEHAMP